MSTNNNIKPKKQLVMRQIDYLRIKLNEVEKINKKYLVEHRTIKNRYKLEVPDDDQQIIFGNNIDIYYNNNTLYVNCSIPYLLHGHNFIEMTEQNVETAMGYLSNLLDVDLMEAQVTDFEVAFLRNCDMGFIDLIKSISGVSKLNMQKRTDSFVAYGKNNIQLKIYNVYKNLKRKVPSNLFKKLDHLNRNTLKFELKISNHKQFTLKQFLQYGASKAFDQLQKIMEDDIHMVYGNSDDNKFDDILYKTLLNANKYTYKNINEMVLDVIDASDLNYSQKCRRKNSLKEKQLKARIEDKTSINSFLKDPRCEDLPF